MSLQDVGDQACVDVKPGLNIQHKAFVPPTVRNVHVRVLASVCANCSDVWIESSTAIRDVRPLTHVRRDAFSFKQRYSFSLNRGLH